MPAPHSSDALSDLIVIDLTRVRSGPTCVRHLADWGANVIKVEQPGDQADFSDRHDSDFQNLHRNKRSITIDLKHPEGKKLLMRLIEKADVLVENFRPDVTGRLGIDYESLAKLNPRLIYASISGFGPDGPYRERPGVDQIAQGMSGIMSITGEPGRGPMRVGIALADSAAGTYATMGILVALHERTKSGKGQHVQTSLLQAQIFMLDFQAARYTMKGDVPKQLGNNHPTGAPTGTFKTKDGYANIAPPPFMWKRFCKAIGRDDLTDHPDYASSPLRAKNRDALNAIVQDIVGKYTTGDLIDKLNEEGIPCGPIYTMDQVFEDPQVKHMKVTQSVISKALGKLSLLAQPFTLSRSKSTLVSAAPECGENNNEVLAEFGLSQDDIAKLRDEKVI